MIPAYDDWLLFNWSQKGCWLSSQTSLNSNPNAITSVNLLFDLWMMVFYRSLDHLQHGLVHYTEHLCSLLSKKAFEEGSVLFYRPVHMWSAFLEIKWHILIAKWFGLGVIGGLYELVVEGCYLDHFELGLYLLEFSLMNDNEIVLI